MELKVKSDPLLTAVNEVAEALSLRYNDHQREHFTVEDLRDQGSHGGAVLLLAYGSEIERFQNLQQLQQWHVFATSKNFITHRDYFMYEPKSIITGRN